MASGIYLNESVWSSPFVGYNKKTKPKGRGPMLEKTRPDHAIRSSVAITKLLLGRDGEMQFFENMFSLNFF